MNFVLLLGSSLFLIYVAWAQMWTPTFNTTESEFDYVPECTRCGRIRLVGCMRRTCFYRCVRRCLDINGTAYHGKIQKNLI